AFRVEDRRQLRSAALGARVLAKHEHSYRPHRRASRFAVSLRARSRWACGRAVRGRRPEHLASRPGIGCAQRTTGFVATGVARRRLPLSIDDSRSAAGCTEEQIEVGPDAAKLCSRYARLASKVELSRYHIA